MKVLFGKGLYDEAMRGLEQDIDVVTFDFADLNDAYDFLQMLGQQQCDAIIHLTGGWRELVERFGAGVGSKVD